MASGFAWVAVLMLTAPSLAEDGWLLQLRPEPGVTQRYAFTQTQNMEMELGRLGERSATSTTRMEFALATGANDADDAFLFELTYERMVLDVQQGEMRRHWDSAETQPPGAGGDDAFELLRDLFVGHTVSVMVTRQGEVREVRGIVEWFDALEEAVENKPELRQMVTTMRESFKPELVRSMCQRAMVIYEVGPVKAGEGWTREETVENPVLGDMKVVSTYTVEGEETKAGTASIRLAIDSKLAHGGEIPLLNNIAQGFRQAGAEVDIDIRPHEATGRGTVWVSKETGLMVHFEATQHVDLGITLHITQGGQQQSQPMQLDLTQEIRIERLDVSPAP
jgi:hypothetical protein